MAVTLSIVGNPNNDTLILSGVISGSGVTLNKVGSNVLMMSGTNTIQVARM